MKKNLKDFLKREPFSFFLAIENEVHEVNLCEVQGDSIFIKISPDLKLQNNPHGFIFFENSTLIELTGHTSKSTSSKKNGLVEIKIDEIKASRINKRTFPRTPFTSPLDLSIKSTKGIFSAKIINLGAGGLCFTTKEDFNTSDILELFFEISYKGKIHPYTFNGIIIRKGALDDGFSYGVHFLGMQHNDKKYKFFRHNAEQIISLSLLINKLSKEKKT